MTMTAEGKKAVFAERMAAMHIPFPPEAPERFLAYHDLLCCWNERMNLTGDTNFDTALDRLYIDSLAPLSADDLFPQDAALIDVGSGAGFPGVPIAIVRPDLRVTLLDALSKRVKFLHDVVETLTLGNLTVRHGRAEDEAHDPALRENFDVAVAKAVASLPVLCELLLPFVRVGGTMVCYKGPSVAEEWEAGSRAAAALGGGRLITYPVYLPSQPDWRHCVVVGHKMKGTLRHYPRKAGELNRKPLGALHAR
ncbi:MAG: 16S rRNA (guanine(527)-N(7))-methyltransferase RsmG [Clostridia bacterium]|nr:16S rRNA (guanine(527)-N(7))-methyltransferase RsmG [Clostridia bacterium]